VVRLWLGLSVGHLLIASAHVSLEHVQHFDSVFVPLGVARHQVAALCLAILVIRKEFFSIDGSKRKGRSGASIRTYEKRQSGFEIKYM
jgi:hypothetical protein